MLALPFLPMKPTYLFDSEIYWNYFLAMFKNVETGKIVAWEIARGDRLNTKSLKRFLSEIRFISFNGINFDMAIIAAALAGFSTDDMKQVANDIIQGGMKPWDIEKEHKIKIPRGKDVDHIDLIEVAPGQASLKIYNGRLHGKRMQDLPYHHDSVLTETQMDNVYDYCENDLEATGLLFASLKEQLDLREKMSKEYGIDLRSKSDAQVAEAVIKKEVADILGRDVQKPEIGPGKAYNFNVPDFISFRSDQLNDILDVIEKTKFRLGTNGAIQLPDALANAKISIGNSIYRMGIGGLHSSEESIYHVADENYVLIDRDVASYYPAIIIGQSLSPPQMGKAFLTVYRSIVERRLAAKKAGDKVVANSLKITINGSFGKFGNKYSALYSPQLLIQTTITGQLALLMLIEELEFSGIAIVSANTDGIVMKCHVDDVELMGDIVAWWERRTGFETEATEYKALYSQDVNNYIAIKPDGETKKKGVFGDSGLMKNPQNEICSFAVSEFLSNGTSIVKTIRGCRDIRKFVTVRTVNGGAIYGDPTQVDNDANFLGKAIRWYYSTESQGPIFYKNKNKTGNHNKVAKSEGAKPLMTLPDELPDDIDYKWYVKESRELLRRLGYEQALV